MLTAKQFEGLKKANLSVDAQKSRDRISAAYKAASSEVKKTIHALSGLTQNTFYNAFQKGTASPKMVLAMAQLLGISPYYFTGESDEKGKFSDDVLKSFLAEKKLVVAVAKKGGRPAKKAVAVKAEKPVKTRGRKKAEKKEAAAVVAKPAVKPARGGRKAAEKTVKAASKAAPKAAPKKAVPTPKPALASDDVVIQVAIPKSPKLQKAIANLDEEGAVLLLRALIRKSEASDNAKALCDIIKSCLLS
ncbi:MAG: hypothetical protein FWD48_00295 [Oscillospiraceae bacterium]|nr:hypothetical protein [Oscillospiraceae bacterium]